MNIVGKKDKRAQSAIEYLMTYGWAIIVILVVLAVLYVLNVFNPQGLVGTTCSSNFKYECLTPYVSTAGNLTFTFGQNTGATAYNIAFACAESQNASSGAPYGNMTSPWRYANMTGVLFSNLSSPYTGGLDQLVGTQLFMQSGQQLLISNLKCYDVNGNPIGSIFSPTPQIATPIVAKVWIKYTTGPGINSSLNPYIQVQIATLSTTIGTK